MQQRDSPRTVGESHIAHPRKGVQTWKPKPAVTKGFPQRFESPDSDGRVPEVFSPRRELTVLIQWQISPYIHYCYSWCAAAPNSLFIADNEANELSDTSMAIFLFSWYNYICLHSSPGSLLLQNCLSVRVLSLWNYLPLWWCFSWPFICVLTDPKQLLLSVFMKTLSKWNGRLFQK